MRDSFVECLRRRIATAALFASLFGLVLCRAAAALDVALNVPETAGVARTAEPCRTGIPLAPGSLTDEKKLRVLDDKGAEVPAQFRVINRREKGDIEWVSVAFPADVPAKGTVTYRLTDGGPGKAVDKPVKVEEGADARTVLNGPLKLVLPKAKFAGLGEVWLDRDGSGKFEQVAKGGALVIEGVDGKVYRSTTDLTAPLKVTLEEQGPLFVVVRIDGEMKAQSADGKENFYPTWDGKTCTRDGVKLANKDFSLGFTVRLHVWKDQTWVRTFVTMRNLAESKGHATLYQDSSASWYWQAGTGKIWDPRLAKNKEMIKDDMAKAGRPDSAYYEFDPGSFGYTTTATGFSFMGHRFYKGGGEVKPGSFSSFEGLGKESAEGLRAPGWIEADDGRTAVTAGCRWFWQMCPKSIELKAPGTVSMGLWPRDFLRGHLFEGMIHRTHEMVYDFRPSGKGLDGKDRFAARFSGDDAFLTFAQENIVKDEWFPVTYRTGVCSAKNWSETMSSQRLVQVFLHDVDKKRHPEKYKDLP